MIERRKSIMLLITYGCNLRCVYCYEPKRQTYRMSFDTAKNSILKQLSQLPQDCEAVEVQFMGGEPFMEFPLIKRISEWIWSEHLTNLPIDLFVQTNGTLVHGEIKEWLFANKHRFNVGLSFDGTLAMQSENRHSSHEAVDLKFFAENWPAQNIKMTVSPNTINDLAEGVVYLHKCGFAHIATDLAMGEKIGWKKENLMTYQEQLCKLVEYYVNHPNIEPFSQLRLNVFAITSNDASSSKTCSCGENLVCIDYDGEVYACHLFAPISVSEHKAKESQHINFIKHEIFTNDTCKECALKAVCNRCYGMNYICTGDVATPSPFHCNAFKIRYAANIRLLFEKAKRENQQEIIKGLEQLMESLNIQ